MDFMESLIPEPASLSTKQEMCDLTRYTRAVKQQTTQITVRVNSVYNCLFPFRNILQEFSMLISILLQQNFNDGLKVQQTNSPLSNPLSIWGIKKIVLFTPSQLLSTDASQRLVCSFISTKGYSRQVLGFSTIPAICYIFWRMAWSLWADINYRRKQAW